MMTCPNCKNNNMAGAMFCAECGAQLVGKIDIITQHISTDGLANARRNATSEFTEMPKMDNAWVSLHVLETGQILPLTERTEYTIGRISEGQPIMPDIDLSPYQAFSAGVSRLHAVIKQIDSNIIFMDLGSANGTYLNGKRLPPNLEQKLSHGDIVALGKFKMQVLVNK